ncbi:hypothetical protein OSTOST_09582 [Ostertagia ostertagi]
MMDFATFPSYSYNSSCFHTPPPDPRTARTADAGDTLLIVPTLSQGAGDGRTGKTKTRPKTCPESSCSHEMSTEENRSDSRTRRNGSAGWPCSSSYILSR